MLCYHPRHELVYLGNRPLTPVPDIFIAHHQVAQREISSSGGTGHPLVIVTQKYSSIIFAMLDVGLPNRLGKSVMV
jgi:hypothetical protein